MADQDGPEGGSRATAELLNSGFQPTAVICVNDFTAIGVLRELRDRGLRVPQDVSVTGFDNIQLPSTAIPHSRRSTFRGTISATGFQALVPESTHGSVTGREIVVEPELILRDSVGKAGRV